MNSGGVVETSDVCLDCQTVTDRDVDLFASCFDIIGDAERLFLSLLYPCFFIKRRASNGWNLGSPFEPVI